MTSSILMNRGVVLGVGSLLMLLAGCSVPTEPLFRLSTNFGGVWGTSAKDVHVVGSRFEDGTRKGLILHFDGDRWSTLATGRSEFLSRVWGSSSDLFTVGYVPMDGGRILHRRLEGGQWTTVGRWNTKSFARPLELFDVWGTSASDVFAVGISRFSTGGGILHYDGSEWATVNDTAFTLGVWGSSSQDVFAVGESIFHFDGSAWTVQVHKPTNYLVDVWGTSGSDVFAVGIGGLILHYDGGWSSQPNATTADLSDVWGSSRSDVFAVGDGGTILHYDGNHWSRQPSGTTQDLVGVWGSSASDVYAVGVDALLHYNGRIWSPALNWRVPAGRPGLP